MSCFEKRAIAPQVRKSYTRVFNMNAVPTYYLVLSQYTKSTLTIDRLQRHSYCQSILKQQLTTSTLLKKVKDNFCQSLASY